MAQCACCLMCPKNRVQYSMRYSWGIRGVFVEYSWDIRMYRVCVGYVSGMYREYVEGDGEGGIRGGRGEYIYSSDKKY